MGVTEYDNQDNSTSMAAIPVMDPVELVDVFKTTFGAIGHLGSMNSFSYNSCIVDLNPINVEGLGAGQFPMLFAGGLATNESDTYKTDKLLLTKVPDISGMKFDTFEMGSHSSDYNLITDMEARKYRDPESNPDGAIDDHITVTLGNGGSYQKKKVNVEKNTEVEQDLYAIPISNEDEGKKYQRNKHFFIDPFELTIAQWCYIKLNSANVGERASKESARVLLGYNEQHPEQSTSKFKEIERSYWKYLSVWEKDEWAQLKEEYKNAPRGGQTLLDDDIVEIDPTVDVRATETAPVNDDEEFIAWLVEKKIYNPLEDTRPYYYATYNEVRGTGKIFKDVAGSRGSNYVIDSNKGDEFQMNSRTGTTSFMDILNNNVVYKTKPRKVDIDRVDGGELITYQKEASDPTKDKNPEWCSGETAGINFDLPTEAQWEYCCRMGSTSALPPNYNLGEVFETNHPGLDLIAWYKYKVIGSLPEPERYCAWRISKMLFGISKNKEQIGNVYEPYPQSQVEGRTFDFATMRGVIDATIAAVNDLGVGNIVNPPY